VINLKALNQYVIAPHFKMESIKSVKGLIQKGDWLTKLDLKDAYLTVPVHPGYQKYLKFHWQGQQWQFTVLPFGLNSAPYIFTKLMKPVVATLRKLGIRVVLYLDDMLLMANSQDRARDHFQCATYLLTALGFVLNVDKSVSLPEQQIEFLGFILDSNMMTISLPPQKLGSLLKSTKHLAEKMQTTLREISQVLGTMVASHPAILPAPLHYRYLERTKTFYLSHGFSFDSSVPMNKDIQSDLKWWIQEASSYNGRPLQITQWNLTIESDASKQGWGASCQGTNTGGPWTSVEKLEHINYLELKAAFLALQSFCAKRTSISVLLLLDNITAITFLNKMGGNHSHSLSDLAKEIWTWCIKRKITIHAEHLPGSENIRADWESRHLTDSSDWKLQREIFLNLYNRLGPFSVDLFASRTNAQLPLYCSWRPDPSALAVDALSIPWIGHHPYMFPPFALIPRCLAKLLKEKISAVIIAPVWPNQIWFQQLLNCLVDAPILLPPIPEIVTNPTGQNHPLAVQGHFPLAAWPVSGDPSNQEDYQKELWASSRSHGAHQQNQHTPVLGDSGTIGVLNNRLIQLQPL